MKEFAKGMSSRFLAVLLMLCILLGSVELPAMALDDYYSWTCSFCGASMTTKIDDSSVTELIGDQYLSYESASKDEHFIYKTYRVECSTCTRQFEQKQKVRKNSPYAIVYVTEEHEFVANSNGGKTCKDCGFTMAGSGCDHIGTGRVKRNEVTTEWKSDSDTQHVRNHRYDEVCAACQETINHVSEEQFEDHRLRSNGKCRDCDYQCPHTYTSMRTHSDGTIRDYDETYHLKVSYIIEECDRCGKTIDEREVEPNVDNLIEHTFENGVCACGRTKDCTHVHTSRAEASRTLDRSKTNDSTHTFIVTYTVTCNDCHRALDQVTENISEAHNLDNNNSCIVCDYQKECAHSSTPIKKLAVDVCNPIENDDTQHTRYTRYEFICPDCHTTLNTEEKIGNEDHTFGDDGVCSACGYVKKTTQEFSLSVKADKTTAEVGKTIGATATPSGGDGSYNYSWIVKRDGVETYSTTTGYPEHFELVVDVVGQYVLVATVTDGSGKTATAQSESITVKEKQPAVITSFTMKEESVFVGEDVHFTVSTNADEIQIVVKSAGTFDSDIKQVGTNGTVSFTRTFSQAGEREISFHARYQGDLEWGALYDQPKNLKVNELSIPAFSITDVKCASSDNRIGGVGDDVTVSWNAPKWPLDETLQPDEYSIVITGPGVHNEKTGENKQEISVSKDETSKTLSGSEFTIQEGKYSIAVYAILRRVGKELKELATGNGSFTITKSAVIIDAPNTLTPGKPFNISGEAKGPVGTVSIQLLDKNGTPLTLKSDAGNGMTLKVAVQNNSYAVSNVTCESIESGEEYTLEVTGYYVAKPETVAAKNAKQVEAKDGIIIGCWIDDRDSGENWDEYAWFYLGETTSVMARADISVQKMQVKMPGDDYYRNFKTRTEKEFDSKYYNAYHEVTSCFTFPTAKITTEGQNIFKFKIPDSTAKTKTACAYGVTQYSRKIIVKALEDTELRDLPYRTGKLIRTLPKRITLAAIGSCGDYYQVETADGKVGFISKDAAVPSTEARFDHAFTENADSVKVNNDLANLSIEACGTTDTNKDGRSGSTVIDTFLSKLGFIDMMSYDYRSGQHTVGHTFAHKTIIDENGEEKELYAVVIRGTNKTVKEWWSNFTPGDGNYHGGYHEGFKRAEEDVYTDLKNYIDIHIYRPDEKNDFKSGNYKVWIVGHSRGAAVGNILAYELPTAPEDTYAYLFATPTTKTFGSPSIEKYASIKNFILRGDIVSQTPPKGYGYSRFGTEYFWDNPKEVLYRDEKTGRQYIQNVASGEQLNELMDLVQTLFPTLKELISTTDKFFSKLNYEGILDEEWPLGAAEFVLVEGGKNSLLNGISGYRGAKQIGTLTGVYITALEQVVIDYDINDINDLDDLASVLKMPVIVIEDIKAKFMLSGNAHHQECYKAFMQQRYPSDIESLYQWNAKEDGFTEAK